MEMRDKENGGFLFRLGRAFSLAAFISTLPLYSPNIMSLNTAGTSSYIGPFVEPLLLASSIIALVAAVLLFHRRCRPSFSNAFLTGMALLYAVGVSGFALVLAVAPPFGEALVGVLAILAAVGLVAVCSLWGRACGELELRDEIVLFAGIAVACVGCNFGLARLDPPFRETAFILLLLIGTAWPVVDMWAQGGDRGLEPGFDETARTKAKIGVIVQDKSEAAAPGIGAFFSVMGTPLVGMAISSFAMGVQPVYLADGLFTAFHIGSIGAAILLMALWLMKGAQPLYSFIYQVFVPCVAFVAVVFCALPYSDQARDVIFCAVFVFYSLVSLLALASACAIGNAREFPHGFILATILCAFTAMSWIGLKIGGSFEFDQRGYYAMTMILTACYGGWMLLGGSMKSWKFMTSMHEIEEPQLADPMRDGGGNAETGDKVAAKAASESMEERIERVAAEAGLSPREREIMGYVGRGHSSVYVAKNLLISESTVYTHVRNIYRKLGICSREELIQLVHADKI